MSSHFLISSDSEGSDDDVGMEIDQLGNVNVNMELKGLSIEEEDFSGIKQLLCPLLPKSNVNVSGLTDDIIGKGKNTKQDMIIVRGKLVTITKLGFFFLKF